MIELKPGRPGPRFGRLTVLESAHTKQARRFRCFCGCGRVVTVAAEALEAGTALDCGCGLGGQQPGEHSDTTPGPEAVPAVRSAARSTAAAPDRTPPRPPATPDPPELAGMPARRLTTGRPGHPVDDLAGQRFGWLVALEFVGTNARSHAQWRCQCDCGRIVIVGSNCLKPGSATSCGCLRMRDLTGQRFGHWTVLHLAAQQLRQKQTYWRCRCDCGHEKLVRYSALTLGTSKSCGCHGRTGPALQPGQRFGSLVLVEHGTDPKTGRRLWACRCDCGAMTWVRPDNLRHGRTRSCGCRQYEDRKKQPEGSAGQQQKMAAVQRGANTW